MRLSVIRDFLRTSGIGQHYYVGKIDSKKDKSIGVYQLKRLNDFDRAVGDVQNDHIHTKPISILIHWTKNSDETEEYAQRLYNFLQNIAPATTVDSAYVINYIEMLNNEPIDVSCDDAGVYERVIEIVIHYENL